MKPRIVAIVLDPGFSHSDVVINYFHACKLHIYPFNYFMTQDGLYIWYLTCLPIIVKYVKYEITKFPPFSTVLLELKYRYSRIPWMSNNICSKSFDSFSRTSIRKWMLFPLHTYISNVNFTNKMSISRSWLISAYKRNPRYTSIFNHHSEVWSAYPTEFGFK